MATFGLRLPKWRWGTDERGMRAVDDRWRAKGTVSLQGLLRDVWEALITATAPLACVNNVRR